MQEQVDWFEPPWGWIMPQESQASAVREVSNAAPLGPVACPATNENSVKDGERASVVPVPLVPGNGSQPHTASSGNVLLCSSLVFVLKPLVRLLTAVVLGFVLAFIVLTFIPPLRAERMAGFVGVLWCVASGVVWLQLGARTKARSLLE